MSKYLKKFETEAQYTAAKSGLILPNVSLITENNKVEYNPSSPTPPTPSHEYVDLGLPSGTKWATMNVGASSITDYGNYYQYGKGADDYSVTSGQSYYSGEEDPLAASADTATQVWGSSWHTPTYDQYDELTANTTYEWTTINGVNGGKFTAQNGNFVFFPAAGYYNNSGQFDVGSSGLYYSSTPYGGSFANAFFFDSGEVYVSDFNITEMGSSIRPVMDA